ncbi:hypothetical protein [Brasilonema bromeliae]|uniref:Uncharacterized protein n=1 Tax=Brasilonema bromeliae SPC951 TaxID=385972 RepID=A0ABX1P4G6_9CYAN|nr:hypothetical protein [Brasilonema bromeliae]NMG19236.1 hypothetical protein [Brasilonema bromeliae SPC951]
MSQNANTYLILPEASEEFIVNEPWAIETYADDLMDELFADINLILDRSDRLSSQTALPQENIPQVPTVTTPPVVIPETQISLVPSGKQPRNNPLSPVGVATPGVPKLIKKRVKKSKRRKAIAVLMGVTAGLAAACIVGVANSGLFNRLVVIKSFQQSLLQPHVEKCVQLAD